MLQARCFWPQVMAEKDKDRAATERAQVKGRAATAKAPQKPRAKTAYQVALARTLLLVLK